MGEHIYCFFEFWARVLCSHRFVIYRCIYIRLADSLIMIIISWCLLGVCHAPGSFFLKVHLTPKYFFRSNKSLHLFDTHCAFLPLFKPNLDFLQAVKVTKSGHHLAHDRASKGLFLGWRHKLFCMHVYKDLIQCKSVCDIKPGIDPCPLLAWSCDRWWLDFVTFTT